MKELIKDNIIFLREYSGLSQKEIADLYGFSIKRYVGLEVGKCNATKEEIELIANKNDVEIEFLYRYHPRISTDNMTI